MKIVYSGEDAPQTLTKSIFLAGPSPRRSTDEDWRQDAFDILTALNYDGVVYAPIWRDGVPNESGNPFNYDGQVEWETKYLNQADVIVFWVPRNMKTLPGLTTNAEYGLWVQSGKVLLGYPEDAEHMRYLDWHGQVEGVPTFNDLEEMLDAAVSRLGGGAKRSGGERDVPLHLWNKPDFQSWYASQKAVGNRLEGAKVVWSFRTGKNKERVFIWALHVNVWIKAEDRNKVNEIVLFRPDISTIVAWAPSPNEKFGDAKADLMATEVVIVKEFRSPVQNQIGMVCELAGGSSLKPGVSPAVTASEEFSEEVGLTIDASRFKYVGARQLCATLSAHRAHTFEVRLTEDEMLALTYDAGVAHGNHEDSEYTFVEVTTVGQLLATNLLDWSNVGMILSTLLKTE